MTSVFPQLYELDADPKRKEFLDDLFSFMQKRGTPVNRVPIMAKQVLDLYALFRLVTAKGGLVEVINRKVWREVTRGLSLPTTITSAAFTLRTQYMKYLYPYECETQALSSPGELQAAIDSNRREEESGIPTSRLALPVGLAFGPAREKVAPEEPPEKRAVLMGPVDPPRHSAPPSFLPRGKVPLREEQLDGPLSLAGSGISSINMALEINGVVYTGVLFARRQPVPASQGPTNPAPPPPTGPPSSVSP
ncbi:AT-rich interactive domain-containing protein 3C [Camelus ferus]|nr:AT-rich interactive domain-containing protein 3C [Camelus ferus]